MPDDPSRASGSSDPLLDKVPPHSLEAEMSVLGAMLLSTEAAGLAVQYVDAECFYRPQHRPLFSLLVKFFDDNKPIDLVLVREALKERGQLDEVGGVEYLVALADSVPTLANAEHYAKVVKEKALLRCLIQAGAEIIRDAHAQGESVDKVLDRCEQRIFEITERKIVSQALDIRTILSQVMQTLALDGKREITGLATGLHDLDVMTRGLQPGEMIVLAARPGVGKSALALNIAEHVAVDLRKPAAFFSLEMSKEELALRLLSARARVDGQKLRKGMANREEVRSLQDVATLLYEVPLYIDDSPGLRVLDLRAKARRLYMRHKIELVIVDYLQLMSGPGADESRQIEVANISRGLKAIARELRIPVLAVAQLKRPGPNQPHNAVPQISDLRESGAIEQDADVVLLLDRAATRMKPDPSSPEYTQALGEAELIIGKQRNGPTGLVKLTWLRQFTRFESWAPHDGLPQASRAAGHEQYASPEAHPPSAGPANLGQYGADEGEPSHAGRNSDSEPEAPF